MIVMSTPVRMGRVSSREAARPTLFSVSTNGSRPTLKAPVMSKVDVCGKSAAAQEFSENAARPALTLTAASPASMTTSSSGRLRTTSLKSRAGTTISPSRSTGVARFALMESSMSVEKRSSRPSPRLQKDARQHGEGAARGDAPRKDTELVDQRRAITRELHPGSL